MENASLQAVSEIAAIDNKNFLVLERGGEFPTEANRGSIIKRIYKICLNGATDISDPANGAAGKLYSGKTVEELKDASTLATNGITPVTGITGSTKRVVFWGGRLVTHIERDGMQSAYPR